MATPQQRSCPACSRRLARARAPDGHAAAARAGQAGSLTRSPVRLTQGVDSTCAISTKSSGSSEPRSPGRPEEGVSHASRSSSTPTRTPTTRPPRRSSRRPRTPTRSCPTTSSARSTIASASTACGAAVAAARGLGSRTSRTSSRRSAICSATSSADASSGGRRQARGADLRVDLEHHVRRGGVGREQGRQGHARHRVRDVQRQRRGGGQQARDVQDVPGQGPGRARAGLLHGADRRARSAAARARRSRIRARTAAGAASKPETSTLTVTVPAGVDDGQTLRLAGKGEADRRAAQPGTCTSCCTCRATSGSGATARTS